jgi:hypothetical protein
LAWRSEHSHDVVNNKGLLNVVRCMEQQVPRSQLYCIKLTDQRKQDERFQAVIAAFDENGKFLTKHRKKSSDPRLWMRRPDAEALKRAIVADYEQASGFNMTEKGLHISDVGLVYGGTAVQMVHNDDCTEEIPSFLERSGVVAEPGTILYGMKEEKENRCKIHFALNNDSSRLRLVNVYKGMAVLFAGWVFHAGADHGGRHASTRLYVDLCLKKRPANTGEAGVAS